MRETRDLSDGASLHTAAINLLMTGYSVAEAAKILRLNPAIVRRWWLSDPMFSPSEDACKQRDAAVDFLGEQDKAPDANVH